MLKTSAAIVGLLLSAGCQPLCPGDVASFSDDPESIRQWYLPALGVPTAWEVERGAAHVVVAVVDNGFDVGHTDLSRQLWANPLEEANGLDDDGNGYIDDVHGWDFLDDDANAGLNPMEGSPPEHRGHGTAAAGIIAAEADNGLGVAGACPECRLMLLRGRDFSSAHNVMPVLAEAVRYATDNGARVVSISDGVPVGGIDEAVAADVEDALRDAREAGVVVVVSAGNDGPSGGVRWPAVLDSVLAVGAEGADGAPARWTSSGSEVDVAAPGECIYTTVEAGGYDYFAGTSASAPIVAGLAALLVASHPDWDVDQVIARIESTVHPSDDADAARLGRGVVDFAAALTE